MGKHSMSNRSRQRAGSGAPVGPDDRELIEPDRGLEHQVPGEELSEREGVFTDRDPEDDLHLAAKDPGDH